MQYASMNDIRQLIENPTNSKAISIFIPTHRVSLPNNVKADKVLLKNAISEVSTILDQEGLDEREQKEYLSELNNLRQDAEFWKHRSNGVAIYASRGQIMHYDLSIEIEYSVHVNDSYILLPLLASRQDTYQYYALDINLETPRLFKGSQSDVEQLMKGEMPEALEKALRIDEYQSHQQHSTSSGGSRDAHAHGHGGAKDNKSKDIEKYYRLIDEAAMKGALKESTLPLILMGDKGALGEYLKINSYQNLEDVQVHGNHEQANTDEIAEKTWSIMIDRIEKQEKEFEAAMNKAEHHGGKKLLVNDDQINSAAKQGMIATLAINIVHKTYDSVIKKMEKRFKIALPSSNRQLMSIESTAREVMKTGGDITTLLFNNPANNAQLAKAIGR